MRERKPPREVYQDPDETLLWEPPGAHPPPPAAEAPRARRGRAWRAGKWVLGVLVGYYLFCVLLLVAYRFVDPPTTGVRIERRIQAWAAGREYSVKRESVPLAALPRHLPRAVVAAEDGQFWEHHGFDFGAMRSAQRDAAGGRRIRGASTLTQQLMKNLFGCTCRNPVRKLYDLALTPAAELILGKNRILELYVNQVEWGEGVFGVAAAAEDRYGVSARKLTRTQSAGLAALLPNPRKRTPGNTAQYRREILRRMSFRGW
ncbi:MAG: monofunctional biosynthetic peptidoglycan transglycosylase [Gemmatimonadetes bacterium]|nr:monofunctional biosynthetic peptidoglycan transglycosylase [Gemmatimonadota bacterium]